MYPPYFAMLISGERSVLRSTGFLYVLAAPSAHRRKGQTMKKNEKSQQTKQYYIYLPYTKQRIPVTKQVYLEYYRPIWRQFKRARAHGQCSCPGHWWWKCEGDCVTCKYQNAGDKLSLEYEKEILGDIHPDPGIDIESFVTDKIIFEQLLKRLDEILPEARRIGELRLAGIPDRDIADIIGIPRSTFRSRLKKAEAQLRKEYGDIF